MIRHLGLTVMCLLLSLSRLFSFKFMKLGTDIYNCIHSKIVINLFTLLPPSKVVKNVYN